MPYKNTIYHIVFSTYMRRKTIDETYERDLYAYLGGIAKHLNGFVIEIGGMPDHVHLVLDLPVSMALSQCVKELKQHSSAWMRANPNFPYWEGWSSGYAIFTCSPNALDGVLGYVRGQKEHHKVIPFEDELRRMLQLAKLEYNPLEMMK